MATKKKYHPIICRRCNDFRAQATRCERNDCTFEEYRDAVWDFFPGGPPPKYYLTLTGGVNAGKTFYLISLINELLNNRNTLNYLKRHGLNSVKMIDPISQQYYNKFIGEARQGRLMLTLDSVPLSYFSLFISDTRGKVTELVFFNTSGEKIEDTLLDRNIRSKSHELQGSAVLHFVDPREDTKLNELLQNPKDFRFGACKDYDIVEFMHELMQYHSRGITLVNNPMAVCVSKFDLLMHRIPYDIPEGLFSSVKANDYFGEIKMKSKSLSDFLEKYSTTVNTTGLQEKYKTLEYFAVAPFGHDDYPAMWDKRTPKGVLDPFLWTLKELKILP
jgi:hypothetical protein